MLAVVDYHELLALNRALMEVRYLATGVDYATRGSVFLSSLHERVIDEIKSHLREAGKTKEVVGWEKWQIFEGREVELPLIVEYLSERWHRERPLEAKREIVTNQLRPFKYTEQDVNGLIASLDRACPG